MLLGILLGIAVTAYCGVAGWRCADLDEQDYRHGVQRSIGVILLRGMLWPVTLAGWLIERPAQLLLPAPGEDTP